MDATRGRSRRARADRVQSLGNAAAPLSGTSLRNTFVMVVLAAFAVATWLYGRAPTAIERRFPAEGTQPLGYYLRGARMLGTDEQGRIAYRILADNLEEMPEQQRLKLDGVRIEYLPADSDSWLISADSGTAPKDGSELELVGDVSLRSEPRAGGKPVVIARSEERRVGKE